MGKTLVKAENFVGWLVGLIVALGVGGLFISGAFENVVLLKYLPHIVHMVVGWIIVSFTLLGVVLKIASMFE